jgi:hypothetical protein
MRVDGIGFYARVHGGGKNLAMTCFYRRNVKTIVRGTCRDSLLTVKNPVDAPGTRSWAKWPSSHPILCHARRCSVRRGRHQLSPMTSFVTGSPLAPERSGVSGAHRGANAGRRASTNSSVPARPWSRAGAPNGPG